MFKFPYTNLHELNLDWILEKVKALVENNEEFNDKADYAVETADEAKTIAEQAAEAQIGDGAVTTAKLADDAVTAAKLADNSVYSSNIVDGEVGTSDLAEGAVTTSRILDGAVTAAKIFDAAVTAAKLGSSAVTNAKIADNAVTEVKLSPELAAKINKVQFIVTTLGSGTGVTTDTDGYVKSGTISQGNIGYIITAWCVNHNTVLIPWKTTDDNWYLTAMNGYVNTRRIETNIGEVKVLSCKITGE